jgi:hypothetical protein
VTTTKDKKFSCGRRGGIHLRGNEVHESKEHPEANEDAEISPSVRVAVAVLRVDEGITRDSSCSCQGPRHGAYRE